MSERFKEIQNMYGRSFREYGDSPSSLLTPKGRGALRFRSILPFLGAGETSVLDYGCGLGYLFDYLSNQNLAVRYTGLDMMPEFVEACQAKYGDRATFRRIEVESVLIEQHDIVFASGVFHIRSHDTREQAVKYTFERIETLFAAARQVLICDFQSPFVDYQQEDALHFNIDEIAGFCGSRLTRRFVLRHDLLPYEFTLIAFKDDGIKRPDNIFGVDL